MEQQGSWERYQEAALDMWRDVFKVQEAWRNKVISSQEHMSQAAAVNVQVLRSYQIAMGERILEEAARYGVTL